ncbi:hypothetical protein MMC29_003948 [Sticta canariensis]|nr:hypothetical protein [Sticta canariensis]
MAAPGPPPPAATISAPAAASVGTPAPEPPAAAPEPAAAAPVAAEADATAEVPAWTDVQDALLLGLKALGNKTWKEIGKLFEGKDTEDLRERYAELTTVPKGETKVDAVVEEEKTTNTTDEETEGKNDKKSKKKNKKRGDTAETNDQEGNDEAVPGKKKKDKHGQDNQPKGILKPDEATQEQSSEVAPGQPSDNGAQLNYKGHPLITFDANDGLSPRELLYLSNLHERLEQEKWLQLASKLFDKTGKRVPSCVLREKFASLNLQ